MQPETSDLDRIATYFNLSIITKDNIMPNFIDLTGQKFSRLTAIERDTSNTKTNSAAWRCLCDCGNTTTTASTYLRNGHTKSCGCLRKLPPANKTHGRTKSVEFHAWNNMKARCYNPKYNQFHCYGGRGIIVCDRWLNSFQSFYSDMGKRPSPKHSIDRINNDGNYEPDNCKWSTPREQANNASYNRKLIFNGETLNVIEWARKLNIPQGRLYARLNSGWSVEDTLTKPKCYQRSLL